MEAVQMSPTQKTLPNIGCGHFLPGRAGSVSHSLFFGAAMPLKFHAELKKLEEFLYSPVGIERICGDISDYRMQHHKRYISHEGGVHIFELVGSEEEALQEARKGIGRQLADFLDKNQDLSAAKFAEICRFIKCTPNHMSFDFILRDVQRLLEAKKNMSVQELNFVNTQLERTSEQNREHCSSILMILFEIVGKTCNGGKVQLDRIQLVLDKLMNMTFWEGAVLNRALYRKLSVREESERPWQDRMLLAARYKDGDDLLYQSDLFDLLTCNKITFDILLELTQLRPLKDKQWVSCDFQDSCSNTMPFFELAHNAGKLETASILKDGVQRIIFIKGIDSPNSNFGHILAYCPSDNAVYALEITNGVITDIDFRYSFGDYRGIKSRMLEDLLKEEARLRATGT